MENKVISMMIKPRQTKKEEKTMKNYTMTLTEEELMYIRSALCDKNLKHTTKAIQARRNGDKLSETYNMERHNIGHNLMTRIDMMCEC